MHAHRTRTRSSRCLEGLVRVDTGLIAVCTAALAVGFARILAGPEAMGPAAIELQIEPDAKLVATVGQMERAAELPDDGARCDSFDARFAGAFDSSGKAAGKVATIVATIEEHDDTEERDNNAPLLVPAERAADEPVVIQGPMTPVPPLRRAGPRDERPKPAKASLGLSLPPDPDHTAIYDITARTVYLPDGTRLEAHSGLGSLLDDPRYIRTKMQGPTPPNVYKLTLRERLFHGVRAIRLIPVDDGKMFGRDGILAHSYMLGPNGQSNGCVSFRDYPAFLNAFLKGEVNRLVVVEHLATTTGARASSERGG
jgi:hypothetical protein